MAEDFPERLETLVRAVVGGNRDLASELATDLQEEAPPRLQRKQPSQRQQLEVYRRDYFHCRYCDRKTIFYPIFLLVGVGFFPDALPFHPNWKTELTHPAVPIFSSSIDHVLPVTHGGHPDDPHNLVTACSQCQYEKGHASRGWDLKPIVPDGWEGLSDLYERLWRTEQYIQERIPLGGVHARWIALLREPSRTVPDALQGGVRAQ
jgi:hypothetical protein